MIWLYQCSDLIDLIVSIVQCTPWFQWSQKTEPRKGSIFFQTTKWNTESSNYIYVAAEIQVSVRSKIIVIWHEVSKSRFCIFIFLFFIFSTRSLQYVILWFLRRCKKQFELNKYWRNNSKKLLTWNYFGMDFNFP